MLLDNAAKHWNVPLAELSTEPSMVVHAKSNRKISYGEIAAFAEVPATAPEIKPEQLKKTKDFRLIGKDVLRVELPNKVNGTAQYSIDVQVPGMIYGTVVRSPVEGGTPDTFDEAKVKAITGVLSTVRLPYGIGVLADTAWAAFAGKEAVERIDHLEPHRHRLGLRQRQGHGGLCRRCAQPHRSGHQGLVQAGRRRERACQGGNHDRSRISLRLRLSRADGAAERGRIGLAERRQSSKCGAARKARPWRSRRRPRRSAFRATRSTLHYTLMGGGFGRRGHRDEEFIVDAVLLSKEAKRPVKMMWTREDDVHNGRLRPITAHYLRAGLDPAGKIVAWHQRLAGDRVTPYQDPVRYKFAGQKDFILMLGVEMRSYDIANQYCGQIYRDSGVRTSSLRGIGFTANKFVAEAFLDEIALEARHRSGAAAARAAEEHAARPGGGRTRGDDGELGQEAGRRPCARLCLHRLLGLAARRHRGNLRRSRERPDQGA